MCWEEYRRHTFAGVLMAIIAPMLVERTERGDEMFMTMLARHSQHALDLGAEELLPAPGSAPAAPLRPAPQDEAEHAPSPEPLWSESWYFDAIAQDGSIGAYVRVGRYPNLGVCWYTALICGPGRPTVAVVDFAAPLPVGEHLEVQTDKLRASHRCERPLERFAVGGRACSCALALGATDSVAALALVGSSSRLSLWMLVIGGGEVVGDMWERGEWVGLG